MRIPLCSGGSNSRNTNKWTQITFLLLREGATSPMRGNYMVKFYS